jgi:hypothetical protein
MWTIVNLTESKYLKHMHKDDFKIFFKKRLVAVHPHDKQQFQSVLLAKLHKIELYI